MSNYYYTETTEVSPEILIISIIIGLIFYLFGSFIFMRLAQKANHDYPWFAFIPILNIVQMTQIAKISFLWILLTLVPYVGIIGAFYIYFHFFKKFGQSGWAALLMFIPLVNWIYLCYLAFSSNVQYEDDTYY